MGAQELVSFPQIYIHTWTDDASVWQMSYDGGFIPINFFHLIKCLRWSETFQIQEPDVLLHHAT